MFSFVKRHPGLSTAFIAALALTVFFLFRLTAGLIYWSDAKHIDQPLAGWMTPRYVSQSWSLPPEALVVALGLEQDGSGRRITLKELARQQGRSLDDLIDDLEAAIAANRQ